MLGEVIKGRRDYRSQRNRDHAGSKIGGNRVMILGLNLDVKFLVYFVTIPAHVLNQSPRVPSFFNGYFLAQIILCSPEFISPTDNWAPIAQIWNNPRNLNAWF